MPTPERTSVEEIVAAGREILEASGAGGLTMQAVATRVGVRAPSATIDALTARLEAAGDDLEAIAHAYRDFARDHPEGFRIMFTSAAPHDALERSAAPLIRAAAAQVGEDDALDAARLVTAWATGFLQMELSDAFRLGGDVDRAFEYGLRRLTASLAA